MAIESMDINVKFIRWMVKKAEGFHLKYEGDRKEHVDYGDDGYEFIFDLPRHRTVYSLLLQRAIEGVSVTGKPFIKIWYCLSTEKWYFEFVGNSINFSSDTKLDKSFNTPDEAKEYALEYLWVR